jgi:serine protease
MRGITAMGHRKGFIYANLIFIIFFLLLALAPIGPVHAAFDGIWKDVRPGSASPSMNYFIQTYEQGSAIVVATSNLIDLYVFLDEDYSDGIEVDDLDGNGHHLTVVFFDQEEAAATLSVQGMPSESSTIYKWFDVPSAAGYGGLWKDGQTDAEVLVNLYVQHYDTGSGLVVLRETGAGTTYAFLDSSVSDGFDAEDLAGIGASLSMDYALDPFGITAAWELPVIGTTASGEGTIYRSFTAPGLSIEPAYGNLTGELKVASDAYTDVDTNDPNQNGFNDSIAEAQDISVPATVGGWSYRFGPFDYDEDFYRVQLSGGPVYITLVTADPDALRLDLYLVDESGSDIVSPVTGTADVKQLSTTSQTGMAYILVEPVQSFLGSSSSYTLIVGQTATVGSSPTIPEEAEFVHGEAIVRFVDGASTLALQSTSDFQVRGGGDDGRPALVRFSATETDGLSTFKSVSESSRQETLEKVKALRKRSDVLWAEPNYIRKPFAVPDDPLYAYQWHYPLINLPMAWNLTRGSEDVVVAVLDTGILMEHPDFDSSRFTTGYDFISNAINAGDGDGIDADPTDPGDSTSGVSSFHGTHVAGTVGADSDNGVGVSGVDHTCRIMNLRVLGIEGGSDYDIYQAMRYAARLSNDSGTLPSSRADVVNMSLGGAGSSTILQNGVDDLRAAGVIVVAAAGNSNADAGGYVPAALDGVVTVSAVNLDKKKAYYSNYGQVVDVAAPGGDTTADLNGDGYSDGVLSTLGDDAQGSVHYTYGRYQGTSMATPHVAGVVALMQAAYMSANSGTKFTPQQFDSWLASGTLTQDLGSSGFDTSFGYGLIDASAAVQFAAGTGSSGAPVPDLNPASLNFGTTGTALVLTVINVGGTEPSGEFNFTVSVEGTPWLSVDKTEGRVGTSDSGDAEIVVMVDRSAVEDGTYSGKIVVTAQSPASGTVKAPVIMEKEDVISEERGDVGPVYVLAVDPLTLSTKKVAKAVKANDYAYTMTHLAAGNYIVAAGTDRDGDSYINDEGEAFGFFPISSLPELLVIGNYETSSADFPVDERIEISSASSDDLDDSEPDSDLKRITPETKEILQLLYGVKSLGGESDR